MCGPSAKPADVPLETEKRLRLWEIPSNMHCTILGTCLSHQELIKIGRRAGIVPEKHATDYEVHAWFVQRASEPARLARVIHKRLDRKYRPAIDACLPAQGEADLDAFWSLSLAKADIPGPYWALMTHPLTTETLRARAFGDVHMLSHRIGFANRDILRRLRTAEVERGRLSDQLADTRRHMAAEHRRTSERHAKDTQTLVHRLREAEMGEAALAAAEARLREFERGEIYHTLRSEKTTLEADLEDARHVCGKQSRKCEALERELSQLRQAHEEATDRLQVIGAECAALETMVQAGIRNGTDRAGADARIIDLRGCRIAYVGGRGGTVGHIRALIENSNGLFSHHDGGIEDSVAQLDRVLNQADVVLCPIDCVSHGACLKAKKFCKRAAKTFVPLRSASLSSLATWLHQATGPRDAVAKERRNVPLVMLTETSRNG